MSQGKNVAKGNGKQGGKNAPATKSVTPAATIENSGTQETNDNGNSYGDGKPTEVVNVTEIGNETAPVIESIVAIDPVITAPIVIAPVISRKTPPKKLGAKRATGGRIAGSGKPTYNIAICDYNELVVGKNGKLKFIPYIANGHWVPTYNGDGTGEIDTKQPAYSSMEEAIAADEVQFGIQNEEKMVDIFGYAQNIKLMEGGFPTTGKTHDTDGKKWKKGDTKLYSCFITATAENAEAVHNNLKAYQEHPCNKGNVPLFELLPGNSLKLTKPQVVAPEIAIGGATTDENTANNEKVIESEIA